MPKIKAISLLMILSLVTSCTSSLKRNPASQTPTTLKVETDKVQQSNSSCDVVLKKCKKAVDAQKETIEAQSIVIETQGEALEHAEKEVKRAHKATDAAIVGGTSTSLLLLLLLLL